MTIRENLIRKSIELEIEVRRAQSRARAVSVKLTNEEFRHVRLKALEQAMREIEQSVP